MMVIPFLISSRGVLCKISRELSSNNLVLSLIFVSPFFVRQADKPEKCLKCTKMPKMPKIMASLAQRRRLRRVSLRLYYKRLIFSA
jgi:hypothetical protein